VMWHFYVRNGIAYLPRVLRTTAGFYLDADPVQVIPTSDQERLVATLATIMAAGNESTRTPRREEYGVPVVAKAAGFSDWGKFARNAKRFAIYKTATGYEIPVLERTPVGAWTERRIGEGVEHLPDDLGEAARQLVAKAIRETSH
jgi:hypothetical protein